MQFGHQEHPAELNESSNPIVKRNPKHRVDDPIDEQEEIDNEIKNNKKKNKGHKWGGGYISFTWPNENIILNLNKLNVP